MRFRGQVRGRGIVVYRVMGDIRKIRERVRGLVRLLLCLPCVNCREHAIETIYNLLCVNIAPNSYGYLYVPDFRRRGETINPPRAGVLVVASSHAAMARTIASLFIQILVY